MQQDTTVLRAKGERTMAETRKITEKQFEESLLTWPASLIVTAESPSPISLLSVFLSHLFSLSDILSLSTSSCISVSEDFMLLKKK